MKFYILASLLLLYYLPRASSFILAYNSVNGTHEYEDIEADFGSAIVGGGLTGVLVFAKPYDGCSPMQKTPYPTRGDMGNITVPTFALIERGECDFAFKVLNAQDAGFSAAIVYNDVSNMVFKMSTKLPEKAREIFIPAVFVGLQSGKELNTSFLYNKPGGPYLRIVEGSFDPIQYYLVPFIIVISICFLSLLLFMLVRCVRDRRRTRQNRLSLARLKQLPVKKFQKGDEYDVCAICLDEYEEGDKLRILPCKHAYHCKCVDPWLTSSKRVCPLCKQKVLSDDESSDTEDEDDSDDERTPLVGSSAATSPNAANWATGFSRQNPIMRALRRNLRRHRQSSDESSTETEDSNSVHDDQTPLLSNDQQHSVIMRGETADVFIHQNEIQQAATDEVEPCCSYGNSQSPSNVRRLSDRSDELMHSSEVYIVPTNRLSTNSITVLTDEDVSPPRSISSSSASGDYQSVTESSALENTLLSSSDHDIRTSDQHFPSMSSDDDEDDIIVLTHGSHSSQSAEV